MAAGGVEGLRIFQLAETFADEVWKELIGWTAFPRDTVGPELVRAADSVGANIAEGHGRYHYREEINFDFYGRGSLKESRYRLRRAHARGITAEPVFLRLSGLLDELEPQLNSYINSLRAKATRVVKER